MPIISKNRNTLTHDRFHGDAWLCQVEASGWLQIKPLLFQNAATTKVKEFFKKTLLKLCRTYVKNMKSINLAKISDKVRLFVQ